MHRQISLEPSILKLNYLVPTETPILNKLAEYLQAVSGPGDLYGTSPGESWSPLVI